MPDIFGYGAAFAIVAIIASLATRHWRISAICLLAFFASIMTFTNLHVVHPYYQTAIAVFLILPAGIAIGIAFDRGYTVAAALALVTILAGQIVYFDRNVAPAIAADHSKSTAYLVGRGAAALTQEGESMIVLGMDWTSEVAYYSGRKTLTLPQGTRTELRREMFENPQAFLGTEKFALVVLCSQPYKPLQQERDFVSNLNKLATIGACDLFAANPKVP